MHRHDGLTLAELLIAIALVAILAGLGMPALDRALLDARRTAAMESLLRAIWFARAEALRRGRPVVLCASSGLDRCSDDAGDWSFGWLVVPDDSPEVPLRHGSGVQDPRARLLANRSAFHFQPFERRSTNGTLAWCDRRGDAASRAVVIAPTGRPRLERGAGSLTCPAS